MNDLRISELKMELAKSAGASIGYSIEIKKFIAGDTFNLMIREFTDKDGEYITIAHMDMVTTDFGLLKNCIRSFTNSTDSLFLSSKLDMFFAGQI